MKNWSARGCRLTLLGLFLLTAVVPKAWADEDTHYWGQSDWDVSLYKSSTDIDDNELEVEFKVFANRKHYAGWAGTNHIFHFYMDGTELFSWYYEDKNKSSSWDDFSDYATHTNYLDTKNNPITGISFKSKEFIQYEDDKDDNAIEVWIKVLFKVDHTLLGKSRTFSMSGNWWRENNDDYKYNFTYDGWAPSFTTYAYAPSSTGSIDVNPDGSATMSVAYSAEKANKYVTLKWTETMNGKEVTTLSKSNFAQNGVSGTETYSLSNVSLKGNTYKFDWTFSLDLSSYGITKDSESGSYTYNGFPYPSDVTTKFDMETPATTITWQQNNHKDTGTYPFKKGTWKIIREDKNRTKKVIANDIAIDTSKETLSFTDTDIKTNESYIYTVAFIPDNWKEQYSGNTFNTELSDAAETLSTETDVQLTALATPEERSIRFDISFLKTTSQYYSKLLIYRDKESSANLVYNTEDVDTYANGLPGGTDHLTWEDTDDRDQNILSACAPHDYIVKLFDREGVEIGKYTLSAAVTGGTRLAKFTTTKGEYPGVVKLNWRSLRAPNDETSDTYVVSRRIAESGKTFKELARFATADAYYTYTDETALPGLYYEYKVGVIPSCSDERNTYSDELTDVGYARSSGTVAGRIIYGSGTSVEGVHVQLVMKDNADTSSDAEQFRYLSFGEMSRARIDMPADEQTEIFTVSDETEDDGFAVQMWLNAKSAKATDDLFTVPGMWKLSLTDDLTPVVSIYNGSSYTKVLEGPEALTAEAWKFVTVEVKGDSLFCYIENTTDSKNELAVSKIDGVKALLNATSPSGDYIDLGSTTGKGFSGFIDEVRIFNRPLTEEYILKNFDHLLAGSEAGLVTYLPMDEGLKNNTFDNSRADNVFNTHHAVLTSVSSILGRPGELALKAYTDKDGNYVITGIPYTGEGSTYAVVPSFGIHTFEPTQQLRYVSNNSLVHNGTDFTDNSSFKVEGTITYKYGDFPVEGVSIYVDGSIATRDNEAIMTNSEGYFAVDVPIGEHFISVQKASHVFVREGRFPEYGKFNFQENLKDVDFSDSTLVAIVGRVAGGDEQAALPVGFGQQSGSKAVIGSATIWLDPVNTDSYRLNKNEEADVEIPNNDPAINSTTTLMHYERNGDLPGTVCVTTDPKTGEWRALLPPMEYKYKEVSTKSVESALFNLDLYPTLKPEPGQVSSDSLALSNGTMLTAEYNVKSVVEYNSGPVFNLYDNACTNGAFGEKSILVGEKKVEVSNTKWNKQANTYKTTYALGAPVYKMNKDYSLGMECYEEYVNADDDEAGPVTTHMPLKGLEVSFAQSSWAMEQLTDPDGAQTGYSDIVVLDDKGEGTYKFKGQHPNYVTPYKRPLIAKYVVNGKTYTWPEDGKPLQAYFLGSVLKAGSNFITKGPDLVEFVLRDPPGTDSYSYIEKGSSLSTSTSITSNRDTLVHEDFRIYAGFAMTVEVGLFGISEENSYSIIGGYDQAKDWEYVNENDSTFSTSTTITNTISTNSSEDYVGDMGDVFIGKSTNLIIGSSLQLGISTEAPNNGIIQSLTATDGTPVYFCTKDVVSRGLTLSTQFTYDQNHIISYLIPEIENTRNSLLIGMETKESDLIWTPDDTVKYISKVPFDDENFGQEDYYTMYVNPNLDRKKYPTVPDEVAAYNSWIETWEARLADNESAKVEAKEKSKLTENYSFSAGASREYSFEVDSVTTISTYHYKTITNDHTGGEELHVEQTLAIDEFVHAGRAIAHGSGQTKENETEKTTTLGFVLEDGDQGDYFSVSVNDPAKDGELFFYLEGGQSSCPYEGPAFTQYYEPGTKIGAGTYQIDNPVLQITNPVVTDIPAGREASITLKLSNMSEAAIPNTYILSYADNTNMQGLSMSIDGMPLTTDGRAVYLDAGETITKVLKVKQTQIDVLDYDDITLWFMSGCQNDPASDMGWICSEQTFSVHFKPTCSDVTLTAQTLSGAEINTVNLSSGSTIRLKATDYDVNFTGFEQMFIQYKGSNETAWTTIANYAVKDGLEGDFTDVIGDKSTIIYDFDMSGLTDQTYQFRARTFGRYGSESVYNESAIVELVKDVKAPQVLGSATPVNGILTPDGEIGVVFNEDIFSAAIKNNNISVTGVLNKQALTHETGLKFSNGEPAATEAGFALTESSFALDMWLFRPAGKACTIVRHGAKGEGFTIGYDADDHLVVEINGEKLVSTEAVRTNDWQYLSVSYDNDACKLYAYSLYNTSSVALFGATGRDLKKKYNVTGRLTFGDDFNGVIQEVTLWNAPRSYADFADKSETKSGREQGLIGYWPMNECIGTVAADRARSRHIILPGDSYWYVSDTNLAYTFDGKSTFAASFANTPILNTDDFCVEFWFRGDAQNNGTMFSVGKGSGKEDSSADKLSVGFTAGKLTLNAEGNAYTVSDDDYLDGNWHHFVLNVRRGATAIVYVDAVAVRQMSASALGGMAGATLMLGAAYYSPDGHAYITDSYFRGSIDEVRVWKAFFTKEAIMVNRNSRLSGDESGLIAYYPMEAITNIEGTGVKTTVPSLADFTKLALSDATTNATSTDQAPMLKGVRQTESVAHTWVASNNKIVISINEAIERIEGCTLEFSIDYIKDLNENEIPGAIKWTAYIDMNRLQWNENDFSLQQEVLNPTSFQASISNQSSNEEVWVLSGLPSWLEASKTQGTLKQLSTETITFNVVEGTPIGYYEGAIYLKGNNSVDEPLYVSLSVTGEHPTWSVNPGDYESSMSLTAQLRVEGVTSNDVNDIAAAFMDGKCVGITQPIFFSRYDCCFVMMDIYGNPTDTGKDITFKVWDASTGRTYPAVAVYDGKGKDTNIAFAASAIIGSPKAPYALDAEDILEQQLALGKGWNWISFNVDRNMGNKEGKNMFVDALFENVVKSVVLVEGQNGFTGVTDGKWNATEFYDRQLDNKSLYLVNMNAPTELNLRGSRVKPEETPIDVNKGWNWIGYNAQDPYETTFALADLEPQEDDLIKGQSQFAYYSDGAWVGSLKYLQPGRGYMYYSTVPAARTFCYPGGYVPTVKAAPARRDSEPDTFWNTDYTAWPGNMTVIANVVDAQGNLLTGGELAAFDGDELRGNVRIDDDGFAWLTVGGKDVTTLTLRYCADDGTMTEFNDELRYITDGMVGTPAHPLVLSIGNATGIRLTDADSEGMTYDVAGRRVIYPTEPGVYIVNGEKKIVK